MPEHKSNQLFASFILEVWPFQSEARNCFLQRRSVSTSRSAAARWTRYLSNHEPLHKWPTGYQLGASDGQRARGAPT